MTRESKSEELRQGPFVLKSLDMVEVLTSPVRHEIHQVLDIIGPATVAELADRMGRKPETLYYHVNPMVDAGVLLIVGERQGSRRKEMILDVAGRPFLVSPDLKGPEVQNAIVRSIKARARLAERTAQAEVHAPAVVSRGNRTWRSEQNHARLKDVDRAKLNQMIDDVVAFVRSHDDPDGETVLVSIFLSRVRKE